jgi:hypothetical protein
MPPWIQQDLTNYMYKPTNQCCYLHFDAFFPFFLGGVNLDPK